MIREDTGQEAEIIAPAEPYLQLLQFLQQSGSYCSGAALGRAFGCSRAAIWKWMARLRSWGVPVEGSSRRGYRLAIPDLLQPAKIMTGLPTRYLRGPLLYYLRLPSTNTLAQELARRQAPEGTILVAEAQTAGRGRLGRQWLSPFGAGLYCSLILRPPLPPADLPKLTLLAAVAVVRAIREVTGIDTRIKWPNDILLAGKKVGGILTETEAEQDQVHHVVLGIGLNVNTRDFPEPLAAVATSLAAGGRTWDRNQLLRRLLQVLDELYDQFLAQDYGRILAAWRQAAATLGNWVQVRQGERCYTGLALDITADGALILREADGQQRVVVAGEIVAGLPPPAGSQ